MYTTLPPFCEPHWELMEKAIDDQGLLGFKSDDVTVALRNWLLGAIKGIDAGTFEPVVGLAADVTSTIIGYIQELGGDKMLSHVIKKGDCPLCAFLKFHSLVCDSDTCQLHIGGTGVQEVLDDLAEEQLHIYEDELS